MPVSRRHLRMARTFLSHRFRELHVFEVQAAVLNNCNLRCGYCSCPTIATDTLSTDQWKRTITELASFGTFRLKFQGGEPTLRPDFRELCATSQELGMLTAVITNGTQTAKDPSLLDHLDEVVVSLDSATPELHDAVRGPSQEAAVETVRLARARGLPTYVVMVVHSGSLEQVEPTLELCESLGAGFHANVLLHGRAAYTKAARGMTLNREQHDDLHRKLAGWRRAGRPILFAPRIYERVTQWPDHDSLTSPSDGPSDCMAGRFYVHIEPNGNVLPCVQFDDPSFVPGNLVRDGLETALRQVRTHRCGDCFTPYLNARKDLFALNPAALADLARR